MRTANGNSSLICLCWIKSILDYFLAFLIKTA